MTARARPAPLVGMHEADVVVLGGGLSGLATALGLLNTSRRVAVIEAGSVGAGASGTDLGHVATGLGCPYTRAVAQYGAASAKTIWEWHRESHDRLRALIEAMGDPCGYERKGGFLLARDRPEAIDLADSEDALRDEGFMGEFLDHYMLEARFDVRGFSGAYWAADDAEVDSIALLGALAGAALARGAAVFEASPVEELEADERGVRARTGGGEVRAAMGVVALGARAPLLVPALAPLLQPFPARRLVCTYPSGPAFPTPVRAVGGGFAWRVGPDFRIAGFGEAGASFEALEGVLKTHLLAPPRPEGRWAGTLCAAPDGLPLVGALPGSPLAVVLGLGTLGHSWAFVAAQWVAEALTRGVDPTPSLLRASRVMGAAPTSS